ncbi:MAG: 6-phospho-beta-glucosidase [Actinomycetes bacterium]
MRLTVLGGGGFRVPLVYAALADGTAGVDEIVLHDVDETRLRAVQAVLRQMAAEAAYPPRVVVATDLDDAVRGCDVVFSSMRVGGLEARAVDEQVALAHGVLGQETTGAGGVSFGLRTVPFAVRVAERVAALAPDAWVVNFTNPAGMVTEAMSRVLGGHVVGICDSPVALGRRVAGALGVDPSRLSLDYVGLNHLGWLRAARVDGRDLLPALLADEQALTSFEEGRLFGPARLRELGAIPNEYLHYYYCHGDVLQSMRRAPEPRGAYLLAQQTDFYAEVARRPEMALEVWRRARRAREETYLAESRPEGVRRDAADLDGGGYEGVALDLMRALTRGERSTLVLNIRNRGALPGLDDDAVVEVPCRVDADGTHPVAAEPMTDEQAELVRTIKAVERTTIEAALTGSRETAVRAMAAHPLVGSGPTAERLLDAYVARIPALAAVFRS